MTDIGELFTRDPVKLTKEDVGAIVDKYRSARQQFVLGAAGSKTAGNPKKIKEPGAKITNLDDLDLDI